MKRVWSGAQLVDTAHFKNLLENAGIRSFIKNAYLGSAIGDLPVYDATPELWVFDDSQAPAAEKLIRETVGVAGESPPRRAPWRCASCGEMNEPQFAVCFNCGASDPHGE
jgi:hypothetical protein